MKHIYLSFSVLSLIVAMTVRAAEPVVSSAQLQTVTVTATELGETTEGTDSYTTGKTNTATKLNLSPKETPQNVSVVTRTHMDDYGLSSINDVLDSVTGVTVERVETDRTYYTARGFDITNFQVDGIGIPLTYGIKNGDIDDTSMYDRVEVVRGANGLMTGVGNPSATINMVRKRPTDEFQGSVKTSAGSWDNYRQDVDVSGALVGDVVRGRIVLAEQDKHNSYIDDYSSDRSSYYGVIEADISPSALLTVGMSEQESKANSPMWGALPLYYSDGTQTDYDISTSTSADWSYWDTREIKTFVEVAQKVNEDWSATAVYTHVENEGDAELFFMYEVPDPVTEVGMIGWPQSYEQQVDQDLFEVYVNGAFELAGRKHELVGGISWSKENIEDLSQEDPGYGFPAIGDFTQWQGNLPRPNFTLDVSGSKFEDKQIAVYGALRFHATDALSLIAGTRIVNWQSEGTSYSDPQDAKETGEIVPYAGAVYDINDTYAVYGSYTKIFVPQGVLDINGNRLDPARGNSKEIGVKAAWIEDKLNGSVALFDATHKNVAEYLTYVGGKYPYAYEAVDYDSYGIEAEISGRFTDNLEATAGYAWVYIQSDDHDARTYIPNHTLKIATSYRLPGLPAAKIGASVDWQDDIKNEDLNYASGVIVQDSYAVFNAFTQYEFTEHLSGALNLNNLTNEKYISSINYDQGFYGTPRNFMASVNYKF